MNTQPKTLTGTLKKANGTFGYIIFLVLYVFMFDMADIHGGIFSCGHQ